MKVFVLDPQRWLRGETNSMLLRPSDGKMCCQGQRAIMLGLKPHEIEERGEICDLKAPVDEDAREWDEDWVDPSDRAYLHPELDDFVDSEAYGPNDKIDVMIDDEERVRGINRRLATKNATYRFALPTPEHGPMTVYEVQEGE